MNNNNNPNIEELEIKQLESLEEGWLSPGEFSMFDLLVERVEQLERAMIDREKEINQLIACVQRLVNLINSYHHPRVSKSST